MTHAHRHKPDLDAEVVNGNPAATAVARTPRIQNPIPARRDKILNCGWLTVLPMLVAAAVAAPPDREQTIDGTRYLPLTLGRQTRYQVTVTAPVGKPRKATATNKVVEKASLNGKSYFKVTTTITGVPFMPDTLIYYRPTADGVYQVLEGDEGSPEWLYLPAKIKIGDRWGSKTPSGDFEFKADGVEDVKTAYGEYPQCLKLSVTIKKTLVNNTQVQWLAPGVGVVKQTDSNAFFSLISELDEVKDPKK
jgi:hypothetical protein